MPVPSPWSSLKDDVLDVIRKSVDDFVDLQKPEALALLSEIAEQGAKQTWLLVNGTDDEKLQAQGNLRSLKAQAIIGLADGVIVTAAELKAAAVKVVETVGNFLLANASKLLG